MTMVGGDEADASISLRMVNATFTLTGTNPAVNQHDEQLKHQQPFVVT